MPKCISTNTGSPATASRRAPDPPRWCIVRLRPVLSVVALGDHHLHALFQPLWGIGCVEVVVSCERQTRCGDGAVISTSLSRGGREFWAREEERTGLSLG